MKRLHIIISPTELSKALKKVLAGRVAKRKDAYVEIYAGAGGDKVFFTICSSRYGERAEAVVKADIKADGMVVTNVTFCSLISKLSAETTIQELDEELIISTGETKYKLSSHSPKKF